jgi:hypothetical protein
MPERQLKLAVLSVERKVATADQVLGAVSLWVADPSQTLGQWLERTGAMSPETRRRLEAEAAQAQLGSEETLVSTPRGQPSSRSRPARA